MPAPAVIIRTETNPPPRSSPTDTGPAFLAGKSTTGPTALVTENDAVLSLAQWVDRYGGGSVTNARLSYSPVYDWVETFFRNGGNRLYFARVVGAAPVNASISLAGTSGATLVVTANEPGEFYNTTYKVSVTNGSDASHRYVKLTAGSAHPSGTDTVLAQSANLTTRDEAAGQVLTDPVLGFSVTITVGAGSGLPVVAAGTALAGGTDDQTTADAANVTAALAKFGPDLGPGQVVAPDFAGTSAVQLALLAHAASMTASGAERHAICDTTDTTTKSTVTTLASTLQGTTNASYGELWHPWVTVAPFAAGGADRRVPASALVCARLADTDARFHPNRAAAGIKDGVGVARWATGVGATYARVPQGASDADDLSNAGVNLIILRRGQVVLYDDLTLVSPTGAEANYLHAPNARYRMWTVARAFAIGEGEQFDQINRDNIATFGIRLEGILKADYIAGILVPDDDDPRPATAYNVDVTTPNTPETMQAGELNANLAVRPARSARIININITAVSLTESVA